MHVSNAWGRVRIGNETATVMEDGELSEGEILSSHEKDGHDKDELSPSRAVVPRNGTGKNQSPVRNPHQVKSVTSGAQKRKKKNKKKQNRVNSEASTSNLALRCEGDDDDGECNSGDPARKRARLEGENGAALNGEALENGFPKVATIMQQNSGSTGKKGKKGNKRNSTPSVGQATGNTVSMLLQRLSQPASESKGSFLMKTIDFSLAIRRFFNIANGPTLPDVPSGTASRRVVVVWLSQVSAKMFTASDESFRQLKSLSGFTFDIENPGSMYFSKMGLEAFMVLPDDGEEEEQDDPVGPFTKAECLLSEVELISNEFPSASTPPQDWAQYVTLSREDVGGASNVPTVESCDKQGKCMVTMESCGAKEGSRDATQESRDKPDEVLTDIIGSHEEGLTCVQNGSVHKMEGVAGYPIFALDCEMVSTSLGLELARVSVVDESLQCTYDSLVKPQSPVLDYLTRYSGITEETLREVTTTLADVQQSLVELLPKKCILLGHSLENDFRALKLSHPHVIDTSCLFTPCAPTLYKPGLRHLTKQLLLEDIQHGSGGHSSVEDAMACMKLVKKKLKEGRECVIPWSNKNKNLISKLAGKRKRVAVVDKSSVVNLFGQEAAEKVYVTDDAEAVERVLQLAGKVDFAFVQMHAVEQCFKTSCEATALREVVERMDEQAARIVRECPVGSVVFVVCGSSCINEAKKLQMGGGFKGKKEQQERLKEEIAIARHGIVRVFVV
ncbi:hypothetical protein EMCRGX_G020221 [Ephydatia muelleri]|eukprot:Em0016g157a